MFRNFNCIDISTKLAYQIKIKYHDTEGKHRAVYVDVMYEFYSDKTGMLAKVELLEYSY